MPANQKHAKRKRPDPDYFRAHLEQRVKGRRLVCSLLLFWRACGHKRCLRARACALESNECFGRFWPLVPEQTKITLRAGMEASAAGHSELEIAVAIARAQARWRATQPPPTAENPAPQPVEVAAAPPRRIAAPARSGPRIRML